MTIRNLDHLLAPRSVALIGASDREGSIGRQIASNLLSGGFKGKISFVNPRRPSIGGIVAAGSIAELAEAPDVAVIATPPDTLPGTIAELGARGTRAAIVITAGIKGALRQNMLDAARPYTLRILGPNIVGLMLPQLGLNAGFSHITAPAGDLAFLSQSGALITGILDWAASRSIGFSHVVSLGDMADVDFGDMLDYLAGDLSSRAILIYMESVTSAAKFMSAARRAARVKPVIVVKSGRQAAGARAAQSHTGALAGSDAAYDAAFRRAGVLRVVELEDLFNAAETLARLPRLSGERLMIVTNGGGAGVLAADRMADFGGVLAELSDATRARLDEVLPKTWSRANPIDIIGDADAERYRQAVSLALEDPSAEAVLAINCPTAIASNLAAAEAFVGAVGEHRKAAVAAPKAVLACWLGEESAKAPRDLFAANGIASFNTPENAVEGFMHIVGYRRAQEQLMQAPPSMPEGFTPDRNGVRNLIAEALAAGQSMLSEHQAKTILAAYGIPTAQTVHAEGIDDVRPAAERVLASSAQAVLKIVSEDLSHKSDIGGVQLGLGSAEEVVAAAEAMLEKIRAARPDARLQGFTVQPMIGRKNAHELILGASVDETFGPMILFGAGGTSVEVVGDTSLALAPLDLKLAHDLIAQTRVSRLLAGYRNVPAADVRAIAQSLVKISQLVTDNEAIRELDINPLIAGADGVVALDARIRIADPAQEPRQPLSLKPYPVEWEARREVGSLGEVLLRPIRPEDEALYSDFFQNVSAEDARLRFFTAIKRLSQKQLARLTQIDYAREMAFVAIDRGGRLLGVARFIADPDYISGEYGVLVRSDLKGQGLGWLLMNHLIDYARSNGLEEIHGSVLAENSTMLEMCRNLGFTVEIPPDDLSMRIVRLDLR